MRIAFRATARFTATLLTAAVASGLAGCNRTNRVNGQVSHNVQAVAPEAANSVGYVYITNNGEGTVSEFDRRADGGLDFLRTAKTGAVNGPNGIAIDPSSRFLYIANSGDGRIYQFTIARNTGALAGIGAGWVDDGSGCRPQQIAIRPQGDFLYVTNAAVHDHGTSIDGTDSDGAGIDGTGTDGTGTDGSIAEYAINSATGVLKALGIFRGDGLRHPLGIAFAPSGKFMYVSDPGAGTLVTFTVGLDGKLELLASTPSLGNKPGNPGLVTINPSGNSLYITDRRIGRVVVASAAPDGRLSVTNSYRVGMSTSEPFGIALAMMGGSVFIYTANVESDTVSSLAVKPDGLDLVGECPTGMGGPTGMVTDPGGRNLYVVDRVASTVMQFAIDQTHGVALTPKASVFTEAAPVPGSHPVYIATTHWDAPAQSHAAQQTD
jgi:DNA-binding beta-propeller fold protein YncE